MRLLVNIYGTRRKEKPTVSILCGDFNVRSHMFWEVDSENNECPLFTKFLISNFLQQLISEPTHVRDVDTLSCIDLTYTDQPFIFTETGVLHLLDSRSKHNIIHGSLNINMPRPPPYKRKTWEYKAANIDLKFSPIFWQ